MLLFFDGFDQYDAASDLSSFGGWSSSNGLTLPTTPRVGIGRYVSLNIWTGSDTRYSFSSDQAGKTLFIGMALNLLSGTSSGIPILDLGGQCTLNVISSGPNWVLQAKNGSTILATSTITSYAASWSYIEVKIFVNSTTGIFELKIDGHTALSFTGNTQTLGTNTLTYIAFPVTGVIGMTYGIDDFYIFDSTGSFNNNYFTTLYNGEPTAEFMIPSADSAVTWTKNSGTFNYQAVDDPLGAPDDDTTYVYSGTSGQKDTYGLTTLTNVLSVSGVKLNTRAERDNTGALSLKTGIKSGTTDQQVTHVLPIGYVNFIDIFETSDGVSTAFTATTVNSLLSTIQVP